MNEHPKITPFCRRTRRAKVKPPARPEWLKDEAAKMWDELAGAMAADGWLDELTAFGFACYCELSRQFQLLSAEIDKLGGGEAAAKAIHAAWLAVAAELRAISDAYFLNPASRAQHGVETKPEPGA